MTKIKEALRLLENLYMVERIVTAMEKEPKYYGTEELLYTNEVHTLKIIAQNEGITQKQLTDKMFRTKGATSVMIKKLEKKGLIIRQEDKMDARILRLYLTDKGKTVNEVHLKYDEDKMSELMREVSLSDEEVNSTNHVLELFIDFAGKRIL
ncbi:MAG: MarR family transcriptional regulator [Dorea sp.]|jgi:DNA-binding MarR family transcriptional regulator|nr:MarR family transcriptional regulator [Dorea sp.]MCI9452917.1 MarR family transcriptional regulator [Dorea sp.]